MPINKRDKIVIAIGCFLAICLALIFNVLFLNNKLNNNHVITVGVVKRVTNGFRQGDSRTLLYEYIVNGEIFKGEAVVKLCDNLDAYKLRMVLFEKEIPVVYAAEKFSFSRLITDKESAEKFNIPVSKELLHIDSVLHCR